jgi:hypothetical protein
MSRNAIKNRTILVNFGKSLPNRMRNVAKSIQFLDLSGVGSVEIAANLGDFRPKLMSFMENVEPGRPRKSGSVRLLAADFPDCTISHSRQAWAVCHAVTGNHIPRRRRPTLVGCLGDVVDAERDRSRDGGFHDVGNRCFQTPAGQHR